MVRFTLQHLLLFHGPAPCWISHLLISCFMALSPGTLTVCDDKMRGFTAEHNTGGTSDETLLGLLTVRKNSRTEVTPRQETDNTELMESKKQTSRGLFFSKETTYQQAQYASSGNLGK